MIAQVCITPLLLLIVAVSQAASTQPSELEPWADAQLPVKSNLVLWLDAMHQPTPLAEGAAVGSLQDGSGHRLHFTQANAEAQPHVVGGAIRFDGINDYLQWTGQHPPLDEFTIVIVATPRSNAGKFRAFLAASEPGKNDFETGFTIDQGHDESNAVEGFDQINVEGKGFGGARNLAEGTSPFGPTHLIMATGAASGNEAIKLMLDGKPMGHRERAAGALAMQNLTLGARFYGLGSPPAVQGFLDGDISEVLVYDRVLSDEERSRLNEYLLKKHPLLTESFTRAEEGTGKPLVMVENPPAVQMFVPGFAARKLPLDLTNINNLRYRADGKLYAVAYDGNIYLLSDTDGDGLEDKATLWWESKGGIVAPVGAAVTPANYSPGDGLFVACKGKVSLIIDTDHDDKGDKEIVVATGWPLSFHQVDAVGVAVAPTDQSIYFGLGCWNFADPYLFDKEGKSKYDISSERGTVLKVSPDFSRREIVCTGIRFSVGMAFNGAGDLFVTDQEGATWLANGNPFDELLHVQPGRHYGFPPRHPKVLPDVIDEPSVFDYAPQHQSTCGLTFNEPVNGGPVFGPQSWRGDAIVCGESRGKIYRTKLSKTAQGYVAQNHLIGSVPMLAIDACVSPQGDLLVACHSGEPDWGSGPTGKGSIYKISYKYKDEPQPALCWAAGPGEVRVAFDRPVSPEKLEGIASKTSIDAGKYVAAGDRFEKIRPGYAAVKRQRNTPREPVAVSSAQITPDHRTLILNTSRQTAAVNYAMTMATTRPAPAAGEITQVETTELAYDLSGIIAEWRSLDGKSTQSIWLPCPDLSASQAFTTGSAEHEEFWKKSKTPGQLTLRGSLNLVDMLRPAVQPGSRLDYTLPPERVSVTFESNTPLKVRSGGKEISPITVSGDSTATLTVTPATGELVPIEIELPAGNATPRLSVSFNTNEDKRARAIPLRRFLVPWAKIKPEDQTVASAPAPELKGGDWVRGRTLFFGSEAACARCHTLRGQGSDLGPDLSNLVHRDYESVLRDIREPSAALNPDYIASIVKLTDGRVLGGIVRKTDGEHIVVRGDAAGEHAPLAAPWIRKITPSPMSLMPTGILEGLGPQKSRDLLTFLLTEPLEPAPIERSGAPAPRSRAEIESVLRQARMPVPPQRTGAASQPSIKPLSILLVSGAKDHGPSEHDYPAFQKRWTTLLSLAENVKVDQASDWPTPAQWAANQVVIFYSANPAWTADKRKDLDAHLAKGRGLIFLHFAVNGRDAPAELAQRIGLAWGPGSKFRHGPVDLTFRDSSHPITRGLDHVKFVDESYWNLTGDVSKIHVLADAPEDGAPRPILWTRQHDGGGRVFVSLLGHYTWTFDDPLFRTLLLRSICWTAHEEPDRLSGLATIGARVPP